MAKKAFDADVALMQAVFGALKDENGQPKYPDLRGRELDVDGLRGRNTNHVLDEVRKEMGLSTRGRRDNKPVEQELISKAHDLLADLPEDKREDILTGVNAQMAKRGVAEKPGQGATQEQVIPMTPHQKDMAIMTIYAEAKRGAKDTDDRQRVAEVLMSRVASGGNFPGELDKVIKQSGQFGGWRDRIPLNKIPDKIVQEISQTLDDLNDGTRNPINRGATHFYSDADLENKKNRNFMNKKGGIVGRFGGNTFFGSDPDAVAAFERVAEARERRLAREAEPQRVEPPAPAPIEVPPGQQMARREESNLRSMNLDGGGEQASLNQAILRDVGPLFQETKMSRAAEASMDDVQSQRHVEPPQQEARGQVKSRSA